MPFRAGQGSVGPKVDEAEAEAEVLEELPPVAEEALVALKEEVAEESLVALKEEVPETDELPPVLSETVSGTQERPKQTDLLVVYV